MIASIVVTIGLSIFSASLLTQLLVDRRVDILTNLSGSLVVFVDFFRDSLDAFVIVGGCIVIGMIYMKAIDWLWPCEPEGDFIRLDPGQTITIKGKNEE